MIHYHTTGKGPTVVLIHGFPNDSSTWEPIIPQLQKQYRLLMPDLPGAGNSAPVADLSMKHMAEQVKLLLDQEQVDQAILVGHSMGGYTAVEFAAQYPERVAGLAMGHSLAGTDPDEENL